MNVIKVSATESTNDFLKQLLQINNPLNWTVIWTQNQTNGKGQRGSNWISEVGKNLTFSILIKNSVPEITQLFYLNQLVSVAILEVLTKINIPNLSIKWPNDILSDNKKIAGILIENSIKKNKKIDSIIGIGLNVNQENFINLPKASSLFNITNTNFDLNFLLNQIVNQIQNNFQNCKNTILIQKYLSKLYKINTPATFQNIDNEKFTAIIRNISPIGELILEIENNQFKSYNLKEITLLY